MSGQKQWFDLERRCPRCKGALQAQGPTQHPWHDGEEPDLYLVACKKCWHRESVHGRQNLERSYDDRRAVRKGG